MHSRTLFKIAYQKIDFLISQPMVFRTDKYNKDGFVEYIYKEFSNYTVLYIGLD